MPPRRTPPTWCRSNTRNCRPSSTLDDAMKGGDATLRRSARQSLRRLAWSVADEQNERDVADAIAKAPHVAKVRVANQRMVVASMETRGATGVHDKTSDSYTLYACSQGADSLRAQAAAIMGVPNEKLRVITDDVGGAFGMKTPVYPEYPAVLIAARTARPTRAMAIDALRSFRHRHAGARHRH